MKYRILERRRNNYADFIIQCDYDVPGAEGLWKYLLTCDSLREAKKYLDQVTAPVTETIHPYP